MNLMKSVKYGLSPEEIERRSLAGKRFKTVLNMHRIDKTKNLHDSLDRYDIKGYSAKKKKLRDELFIGGKVLVLAKRIKKKAAPYKFDKQNISYFNNNRFQKSELFTIRGNFIM